MTTRPSTGRLVVFMNKCDMVDDAEMLELVEMEMRDPHRLHRLVSLSGHAAMYNLLRI